MRQGQESHERSSIREVKESMEDGLLTQPGVVGVDIGEKVTGGNPTGELAILVYVRQKKQEEHLSADELIPRSMEGVKTDVQELVVELQPLMQARTTEIPMDIDAPAVLRGGLSMGPSRRLALAPPSVETPGEYGFVGTLGAMVTDRATGAAMALTNFHVACLPGWSVGDRMVQPGIPDGGIPGTSDFGSLTRALLNESVDSAVVRVDPGLQWLPEVQGIGEVRGDAEANVGGAVQKCGRTTGCTSGTVGSLDATLSLDYGDGVGLRTLRRQIRIDTDTSVSPRFSDQGDSGSVIMDLDRRVIGLLFGGSSDGSTTFANPIDNVLEQLSVDLAVSRNAGTRATTNS